MGSIEKPVWGWLAYDWANSAFATTVMAGFFPIFFKSYWSTEEQVTTSTAMLGFSNSLAGVLVALSGPLIGAAADRANTRKRLLLFFAYLGSISTCGLYFAGPGDWSVAALFYIVGIIGFSSSLTFYDALLPSIAGPNRMDRISGMGFAAGYLGGGLLFLLNVLMTLFPEYFLLEGQAEAVRVSFLTVGVWWGGFTMLSGLWIPPEPRQSGVPVSEVLRQGLGRLRTTLGEVKKHKKAALFLVAYWCYIDGVDTIIRMAVDYGLSIGFETKDLITALLIVQFVGFPAALLFGYLGQRLGPRRLIVLGLWVYVSVTLWGVMMTERWEFYLLAVAVGSVQGGVQCLSRSYFARLIPVAQEAEFFGFYNMVGKCAVIIGPALMGTVGLAVDVVIRANMSPAEIAHLPQALSSRISMASVLILFLLGLYLLPKKKTEEDGSES